MVGDREGIHATPGLNKGLGHGVVKAAEVGP